MKKKPVKKPTRAEIAKAHKAYCDYSPIERECRSPHYSVCATAYLYDLDWKNWFQEGAGSGSYIHVKHKNDDTWHRVFPKRISGRSCTRLALHNGILQWLHDKQYESE